MVTLPCPCMPELVVVVDILSMGAGSMQPAESGPGRVGFLAASPRLGLLAHLPCAAMQVHSLWRAGYQARVARFRFPCEAICKCIASRGQLMRSQRLQGLQAETAGITVEPARAKPTGQDAAILEGPEPPRKRVFSRLGAQLQSPADRASSWPLPSCLWTKLLQSLTGGLAAAVLALPAS